MQKPLQITFKDLERSDSLEALVRERAERLERFHPAIVGCRVVIEAPYRTAEGTRPPLGLTVEVEVPGRPLIVAKAAAERHDAKGGQGTVVSRAFEAAQRQLQDSVQVQKAEVKQHDNHGSTGQVLRLFPEQSYGFIEVPGAPDLYFTRNAVVGGDFDDLVPGTLVHVTVATTEGPMGPQASSVRLLDATRSVA
jgi:cold shock CspA family protein